MIDLCREKLENFEKVEKSFKKYFDSDLLEYVLDRKADVDMINQLNHVKANKSDLVKISGEFTKLNDKLKQLAVLQLEIT
jgi:hypothetical protein